MELPKRPSKEEFLKHANDGTIMQMLYGLYVEYNQRKFGDKAATFDFQNFSMSLKINFALRNGGSMTIEKWLTNYYNNLKE